MSDYQEKVRSPTKRQKRQSKRQDPDMAGMLESSDEEFKNHQTRNLKKKLIKTLRALMYKVDSMQ